MSENMSETAPASDFNDSGCVQDSSVCEQGYIGQAQLLDLSDDVLLFILKYCSPRDLKALGYTCPRLGALICDHTLWQRVDVRDCPTGRQRLQWFLANCFSSDTVELKLKGFVDPRSRCLGIQDPCPPLSIINSKRSDDAGVIYKYSDMVEENAFRVWYPNLPRFTISPRWPNWCDYDQLTDPANFPNHTLSTLSEMNRGHESVKAPVADNKAGLSGVNISPDVSTSMSMNVDAATSTSKNVDGGSSSTNADVGTSTSMKSDEADSASMKSDEAASANMNVDKDGDCITPTPVSRKRVKLADTKERCPTEAFDLTTTLRRMAPGMIFAPVVPMEVESSTSKAETVHTEAERVTTEAETVTSEAERVTSRAETFGSKENKVETVPTTPGLSGTTNFASNVTITAMGSSLEIKNLSDKDPSTVRFSKKGGNVRNASPSEGTPAKKAKMAPCSEAEISIADAEPSTSRSEKNKSPIVEAEKHAVDTDMRNTGAEDSTLHAENPTLGADNATLGAENATLGADTATLGAVNAVNNGATSNRDAAVAEIAEIDFNPYKYTRWSDPVMSSASDACASNVCASDDVASEGTIDASKTCPGPQFTFTPKLMTDLKKLCSNLTTLFIEYCNLDYKSTNLALFPPKLKMLSLRGTRCFNQSRELSYLGKIRDYLPELVYLDVSECEWFEPAALMALSKLPYLEQLIMRRCVKLTECVAYASLAARYGFRTLRILDARESPLADSEVSALGWLPALEQLFLAPPPAEELPPEHVHSWREPFARFDELQPWELEEPDYYKTDVSGDPEGSPRGAMNPEPPSHGEQDFWRRPEAQGDLCLDMLLDVLDSRQRCRDTSKVNMAWGSQRVIVIKPNRNRDGMQIQEAELIPCPSIRRPPRPPEAGPSERPAGAQRQGCDEGPADADSEPPPRHGASRCISDIISHTRIQLNRPRVHKSPHDLVTDTSILRFGRGDLEQVVHIGVVPVVGEGGNRPDLSSLRVLSVTGYRNITDRSLMHLTTAAPHLRSVVFTGTNVTEKGAKLFMAMRPECDVEHSPFRM